MRGPSTLSSGRLISSLVCVLLLECACGIVGAQENPQGSKSADVKQPESSSSKKDNSSGSGKTKEALLPSTSIRYLPDMNGELHQVPLRASLEGYLKFLEEDQNKAQGPQPYTISEVEIVGVADDERATLKVVFTVRLHLPDQLERVPLYFSEAILKEHSYTGDGEQFFDKKDPKQGYVWWFKGRGPHRLQMTLSVPLQKLLPSRHLYVSLPKSPISRMQMTLPYSAVTAKVLPEQAVVEQKSTSAGKTLIEAFGLGSQLDLTWQPNSDVRPNEVSLESQTMIRAQVESDQVLLRAEQRINSSQGFEQVVVRLPVNSELVKLDDSEKQSYRLDPENRQRVIVTLKEKSNSAQLNWTLRLPIKIGTSVTIDGFAIDGARKQTGKIGFSIAEGLRMSRPPDPTLLGINAGEFPTSMGPVVHAYQFFSQPFKLSTTFDEVKPYYEVKPQLLLTASTQSLNLDGEFQFRVDRDSMNEVVLSWPNYKSEGWTIDSVDEPGVVESYSADDKGLITVRLVKFRSGRFSVHLHARRHFKAGEDVGFSLPRPKSASRLSSTTLILANAENVDTDLTARGETVFHPLSSSSVDPSVLPEAPRGLRSTIYRVDTDEQSFALRVIPQKQRIRTESSTEVKWQDNQFQLVQHLMYDVAYERLSQIRLTVPTSIEVGNIQFVANRDDEEVEFTPELLQSPAGTGQQIQLQLGEALLGHFEIQARFAIPFPKDSEIDSATVSLPILTSLDGAFLQTRVTLVQPDWFDAEPLSVETWHPQLNRREAWKWMAVGEQSDLRLKLTRSTRVNETGNVSAALIRVALDGTGDGAVRAQFRVTTRASSLTVLLPGTAKSPTFYWGQKRVPERECVESPAGSHRYQIQLPEQFDGPSQPQLLLTVDYQDDCGSTMGWSNRLELRSPQILNCSWSEVIWQTILPTDQHLFTYPRSASPMFRWERVGLVWSRVSDPNSDRLQRWIAAGTSGVPTTENLLSERNGNLYTFSQFDSPKTLVFQTMNSPMVLLIGAGFSLVVGFIMIRLVVLRHVLTLLLMGLIIATVGLWYSAPLELLIQPMIAGLIFPAAAVFLDGWIRRRYDNGVLPFDGQDDFPPIQAFGSHYVVRQSDPNEATLHRPTTRDSEPSVPIETGSGVS